MVSVFVTSFFFSRFLSRPISEKSEMLAVRSMEAGGYRCSVSISFFFFLCTRGE